MEIVTKIAPIALALIMLGLGLGLTIQDFLRILKQPKDFFIGFVCQIIVLPIIAFLLIKILNTPMELALGVMIIAAAPGGVTSNVLTKFANGDVALSVSLTAIISLISILTVPFIVFKSAELLNVSYISNNMRTIQRLSIFLFALVFIAICIEEWDKIISFITRAGLIALILNVVMMTVGFYVAKVFASGMDQRKCISLECGLQNGTLAVFVSTQLFDNIVYMVPTAAYALIMFVTSIIFVFLVKNLD